MTYHTRAAALEAAMEEADQEAGIARALYEYAAKRALAANRAVLEADLAGRCPHHVWDRARRADVRTSRLRTRYSHAVRARVAAARAYSTFVQQGAQ